MTSGADALSLGPGSLRRRHKTQASGGSKGPWRAAHKGGGSGPQGHAYLWPRLHVWPWTDRLRSFQHFRFQGLVLNLDSWSRLGGWGCRQREVREEAQKSILPFPRPFLPVLPHVGWGSIGVWWGCGKLSQLPSEASTQVCHLPVTSGPQLTLL